jgi:hypothetical protein
MNLSLKIVEAFYSLVDSKIKENSLLHLSRQNLKRDIAAAREQNCLMSQQRIANLEVKSLNNFQYIL